VPIIDRREIELDLLAVKQAIEWSPRAAQAFGLPPLQPETVRCNPADAMVEVTYGRTTAARIFMLRAEALGAILISYCNRIGIPVPRNAEKGVRIERMHVVIVLTLRLPATPQPQLPEGRVTRAPEAVRAWAWMEQGR
jgi:hypothetical protein